MKPRSRPGLAGRWSVNERTFFLPLLALTFGAGIGLAPHVSVGLWPLWFITAAALLYAALSLLRLPLRWVCLPLALMAALLLTQSRLNLPAAPAGFYARITATEVGQPAARDSGGLALTLCDVTLDGVPQPGKAYCTLDAESGFTEGDLFDGAALSFQGSVYLPSGKANANDFDFRMWLCQNGIGYGMTSIKGLTILNTPDTAPVKSFAARVRVFCAERFAQLMGGEGSLAMAMLLGNRDALGQTEQLAFQRAGVAHLMAVSGLHVGLLATALLWLLGALSLRRGMRLGIMAAFLTLYCMVTGFSPASVRAAVMTMLVLLSHAAGRKPEPLTTLSAAALVVLLINPLQLFSAGFVLSFTAMAGIMLLYPRILRGMDRLVPNRDVPDASKLRCFTQRTLARGKQLFSVSLAAQIGVLLPTAAYFHRLPLYGIVFNLLAVPLAGLLVPLYALTLLVSLLPWVGWIPAVVLGWAARIGSAGMLWLTQISGLLPYAQVRVPSPNLWAYAGLLGGVLAFSGYVRARFRTRALAALLVVALAALGAYAARPAALRYYQFAAGKADAALIMDGDATVAVDVGNYGSEVASRLMAEGRSLDALILTHLHLDHAQGVSVLLDEGIDIGHIYLPEGTDKVQLSEESRAVWKLLQATGIPITYLAAGDMLRFHELSIRVLWPENGRTRKGIDANERSMATLIELGSLRILNAADNSIRYEQYFVLPCDVLKVAHHGSAASTTAAFLALANPTVAIVTCGSGSASPAEETLERLEAHGAWVLRTDETGEIVIQVQSDGIYRVKTYLTGEDDELQ
ncbi:MAG: ComEC/Rec2 family competence protein [Eubacteriales bacterium]|nr:ComEC/Rec2 family competence protein [Eubacteriales bacterium]